MGARWKLGVLASGLVLAVACACRPVGESAPDEQAAAPAAPASEPTSNGSATLPPEVSPEQRKAQQCQQRIAEVTASPGLPGAPKFDQRRTEILARAKSEPVLLLQRPEQPPARTPQAQRWRRHLQAASAKAVALYGSYTKIIKSRALARDVLLADGYLYAESPSLAFGLSYVVRLEHLFDDPELWLQRGAATHRLERRARRDQPRSHEYVHADGALAGQVAVLLLLDRVATTPRELASPLHRDVTSLREQLQFDRMKPTYMSEQLVVADLRYGDVWVPSLLDASGVALVLECEAIAPEHVSAVRNYRQQQAAHARAVKALRSAMDEQMAERMMFDEPRTEEGQQDGKLRDAWKKAYLQGRTSFSFNDDYYRVFDRQGRPIPPQVCIDFIVDTLERASGSWWQSRGQPRMKTRGRFNIDEHDIGHRRRVAEFVRFARNHPEMFDVHDVPRAERIPLRRRSAFFRYLERQRAEYQPGDIVVIYGMREDDDEQPHYHSFYVYADDPLTGMPTQLASNAVVPQVRSWEGEMHNAPRRTIRTRIRPRPEWLTQLLVEGSHDSELGLRSEPDEGSNSGPGPGPTNLQRGI